MAAPAFDHTEPAAASAWDDSLDAIRDNQTVLMHAAMSNGYRLPGWTTTVTNPSEPTAIEMVNGSRKMRWEYTWSGGAVQTEVWKYDRGLGSGLETLTGGTLTISYDGNGDFSGVTSA